VWETKKPSAVSRIVNRRVQSSKKQEKIAKVRRGKGEKGRLRGGMKQYKMPEIEPQIVN